VVDRVSGPLLLHAAARLFCLPVRCALIACCVVASVQIYANANAWLTLILALAIPLLVELIFRYSKRHLCPTYTEVIQEHDFLVRSAAYQRMTTGLDAPVCFDSVCL
jgi:hypothetical protein